VPVQAFVYFVAVDPKRQIIGRRADVNVGVRLDGDIAHPVWEAPPLGVGSSCAGEAPGPLLRQLGRRSGRLFGFARRRGLAVVAGFVDGGVAGVLQAQVGAVPAGGSDPLLAGFVDRLGDEVGRVATAGGT